MVKITSATDLEKWLANKPNDWAQALAARSAMRALPYLFTKEQSEDWVTNFALNMPRALFLSWIAGNVPAQQISVAAEAAFKAGRGAKPESHPTAGGSAAAAAARYAVRAIYAASAVANVAKSAEAAASAAAANAVAIKPYYHPGAAAPEELFAATAATVKANTATRALSAAYLNVSHDCNWLESWTDYAPRAASRRLSRERLWPAGKPTGWSVAWSNAADRLRRLDMGFEVWIDWFDRRIVGRRAAFDIPGDKGRKEDKGIVANLVDATDEDFWNLGAKHVNSTLKAWIDAAQRRAAGTKVANNKQADFFISYATEQEYIAREVAGILAELGYKSIAQFKDFAQGNFVTKMREGIAQTDRFIALQSKAYWNSDHCQSEWNAAYARDPGAKRRKIVPFLLEPVPLPPIASEIVYKPLFNLTKAQRKKAIVEWIEYEPISWSPGQLRKRLAEQASPDVRLLDQKIDAGPNSQFDKPLVDLDLAELPANLRALLKALIDSLPPNTPRIVGSCLKGYHDHLIERGAQPIVGTIVPFAQAVKAQIAADSGHWDAGLDSLFASFFKRHKLLITHFPLDPERELTVAETPIDDVKASGSAILDPVQAVGEAISELKFADLTTVDFDRVAEAHQEFSRDIASLPMPTQNDGENVTPRRRYVLGTIGFYERLLAALGAGAGIAALPQGQAAIAVVRAAIEAFMRFIV